MIGGWASPRAGLDAVEMRKIPSPRRESKPWTPIVQPVASRYTDWVTPILIYKVENNFCQVQFYQYVILISNEIYVNPNTEVFIFLQICESSFERSLFLDKHFAMTMHKYASRFNF
jgi:hypothetical protein